MKTPTRQTTDDSPFRPPTSVDPEVPLPDENLWPAKLFSALAFGLFGSALHAMSRRFPELDERRLILLFFAICFSLLGMFSALPFVRSGMPSRRRVAAVCVLLACMIPLLHLATGLMTAFIAGALF